MGLAVGTAKYLLFFFNFIFFVTGIVIIAIGGVTLGKLGKLDQELNSELTSPAVLLIVVGVFVALISFFGCCGAIRNSYCMLLTFSILLALIFVLELAAGIAAYVKKDNLVDVLQREFYDSFNKSHDHEDKEKWWKELEENDHCCGVENASDYTVRGWPIPSSCCKDGNKTENCTTVFTTGCFTTLKDQFINNIVLIGGIGVGIAFVQILGIVYACCLASAVKEMS
uniref:Tetraspanin n=1 Tax=Scolopendra viridis TaxID=118503 RepID=A0A4D5R8X1_SCOVI